MPAPAHSGDLAARLRAVGCTWTQAAEAASLSDRSTARRAALRALDRQEREGRHLVDEAQQLRAAIFGAEDVAR